jgi:hypothetical protein
MSKRFKLGCMAAAIVGFVASVVFFVVVVYPSFARMDRIRVAQDNNDQLLHFYGQRILDYRKAHGGASPPQITELLNSDEINDQKDRQHAIDTVVEDPMHSFELPKNAASHVLVYEKPGMWTDGTVGVCFDDLTVKRLTQAQFDDLAK